jgi:hypothetical protein
MEWASIIFRRSELVSKIHMSILNGIGFSDAWVQAGSGIPAGR